MNAGQNLSTILADEIVNCVRVLISKAKFDRSSIGRVVSVHEDYCIVNAFGQEYKVTTNLSFSKNQRVAVVAPQGNFKKLYMIAI